MELKYGRSMIGMNNVRKGHVVGITINSAEYAFSCSKACLPDPAAQYQIMPSPSRCYSTIRHRGVNAVISKMIKLGESMDGFAQGIREHVKLGHKWSETVKGKLRLGARILQVGGVEKMFKQKFNVVSNENLLNASQCYLSTTAGPIAGLLFVSNQRVAFWSERSIKVATAVGKLQNVEYKVMIPLRKIKEAVESEHMKIPMKKYVKLETEDNFEFWFLGFLNHQRALKCLSNQFIKPGEVFRLASSHKSVFFFCFKLFIRSLTKFGKALQFDSLQ